MTSGSQEPDPLLSLRTRVQSSRSLCRIKVLRMIEIDCPSTVVTYSHVSFWQGDHTAVSSRACYRLKPLSVLTHDILLPLGFGSAKLVVETLVL